MVQILQHSQWGGLSGELNEASDGTEEKGDGIEPFRIHRYRISQIMDDFPKIKIAIS